jgi:ketosteroid isomerase-like protein
MSRENVETLRRVFNLYNRRDFDAAVQYLHPEASLHPALTAPPVVRTEYRGRAGVKEFYEVVTEVWESFTVHPKEIIEAPGSRLVVVENWRARGRDGIEIDTELTDIYEFRDGLCFRIDGFRTKAEALEAAGLSE